MKKWRMKSLFTMVMIIGMVSVMALASEDMGDTVSRNLNGDNMVLINEENFPDAAFRGYIRETVDSDGDGVLSENEIVAVQGISVGDMRIRSLKGLEFFPDINYLECWYNDLGTLDLSKNPALIEVSCDHCKLTSLNVSQNTALESLRCYNNYLTELDMTKNTALTELNCVGNKLTSLDVSKNTVLENLNCYNNDLTELDVTKNTALTYLDCSFNWLTSLDVSENTVLDFLQCDFNNLQQLDVSKNTVLTFLHCDYNCLTELDVSKNIALEKLACGNNDLRELDVTKNINLQSLDCSKAGLTVLDLSKNTALKTLGFTWNQLTSLDISANTALRSFSGKNNVYSITLKADRTFDLNTLPGGFEAAKASAWEGGTVNGNILTVHPGVTRVNYTYNCGNYRTLTFSLDTGEPGEFAVDHMVVTGVTEPVAGQTAGYSYLLPDGAGYEKSEGSRGSSAWAVTTKAPEGYNKIINAVNHFATNSTPLIFEEGKYYTFVIFTKPKDGYYYANKVTATLNGMTAGIEPISASEYYVWYTFYCAPDKKPAFADVSEDDWFYDAVMWAVDHEITSGAGSPDTFQPYWNCTRSQIVTFLWNMAGRPTPATTVNPFVDVSEESWYYKAVLWAVENGITSGKVNANTFCPDDECSRAEAVMFLWNAAGRPEPTSVGEPFVDVLDNDWFRNAVLWAVENQITAGAGATDIFKPAKICTRSEIVQFLYRAFG